MNSLERFTATLERKPVDRPASWLGIPAESALPGLYEYFGVADMAGLKAAVGDDIWPVEVPYNHPPANHIACAFDFAKQDSHSVSSEERTLTDPGFFEDYVNLGPTPVFSYVQVLIDALAPRPNITVVECSSLLSPGNS